MFARDVESIDPVDDYEGVHEKPCLTIKFNKVLFITDWSFLFTAKLTLINTAMIHIAT